MRLNLHALRIFLAVVEHGSFSKAAEALFITQPAVSKAVKELEQQLDLPLVERRTNGARGVKKFALTESGESLFNHAKGIFALERAAVEDIRARVGVRRGSLSIGASTTIAGYWLPHYVARFASRFPEIRLRVVVENTEKISSMLLDCSVDLALVEGAVDDPRIIRRRWREDPLVIVAGNGFRETRIDSKTLSEQCWILREAGSGTYEATIKALQALKIRPSRQIEIASNEAIARTVVGGGGIALLPQLVVADLLALKGLKLVNFTGAADRRLSRTLYLLELKDRPSSPAAEAFLGILQESVE